jgi:multimeric flavodoxin WrbA
MKVVAIGGSPRLDGNSNYLLGQALNELASCGIETEKIILNEYKIGFCQAHDNCRQVKKCLQQDDAPWILERFSQADGVIVASPVYFGSVSAQIKTFMDRSFFLFGHDIEMKAKCFGLIAIAGRMGFDETLEELRKFTGPPGMRRVKVLTLKGSAGGPDKHVRDNPELVKQAREMGKQMAEVLTQA